MSGLYKIDNDPQNITFRCAFGSKQWTCQQRASRVLRLEIIKIYSRVWHCAGADICWKGGEGGPAL
jgi:hypothetical protein